MKNFFSRCRKFSRDDRGASTIEFVILFPILFAMIAATFDAGVLMMRYVALENATDRVVRDVRMNVIGDGKDGAEDFVSRVCDIAPLLKDCKTNLFVEMTKVDSSTAFVPDPDIKCINRSEPTKSPKQDIGNFYTGEPNDIVYFRVCLIVDRHFPSAISGMFKTDASGGIKMVADSAFVVEPL